MTNIETGERKGPNAFAIFQRFGPLLFLVVLIAIFTALKPTFIDPTNVFNIMRAISITGLIALGMTFVILTAGIDLSVGSLLAFCGMVAAVVAKGGNAEHAVARDRRSAGVRLVRRAAGRDRDRRADGRGPGLSRSPG